MSFLRASGRISGFSIVLVAALGGASAVANHECDKLLELGVAKHIAAWVQEKSVAQDQGRPIDVEALRLTSPLYREMSLIEDSRWSAVAEAIQFIKKYEKVFLPEDVPHVLDWAFRIKEELALETALMFEWQPQGELLAQMRKHAVESVGMPVVFDLMLKISKKKINAVELAGQFEHQEIPFLFLQRFAGESEKRTLRRIRMFLKMLPNWEAIQKTRYGQFLEQLTGNQLLLKN